MEVIHDHQACRFVINNAQGEAELTYEWYGDRAVNFTHTYVPFCLRGQGLADILVETGLRWARGAGIEFKTCCWFVEKHLKSEADSD